MNLIFTVIFVLSAAVMLVNAPADFLPAMLDGGLNAAKCCLTLLCIYVVWMGLSAVAEDARLTSKAARLLSKPCGKLFKTNNNAALENITMNLSCNLLGIGGAATPYAVKAVEELEKDGNAFAQNLLFIVNATSVQLIPTTVIALRASAGSAAAFDIALPSLIATFVSTFTAVILFILITKIQTKFKPRAARRKKCAT
ncbi:MAG: nucleoside recognition protein [Clostridia bacterium]|nr:nucleoside recognition protein [Clostridia bacterium]